MIIERSAWKEILPQSNLHLINGLSWKECLVLYKQEQKEKEKR